MANMAILQNILSQYYFYIRRYQRFELQDLLIWKAAFLLHANKTRFFLLDHILIHLPPAGTHVMAHADYWI